MRYEKQTLVREIYENSPIAHDLLNSLTKLGQKKYGFCKDETIKTLTVEQLSQMIAHLIDETVFDKMLEIANRSSMEYCEGQMPECEKNVLYEYSNEKKEINFSDAKQMGIDCVIVPWKLFAAQEESQKLIHMAHGEHMKLFFKLCLHRGTEEAELDWNDPEVRAEVCTYMRMLTEQGCDGFCLEQADLLTSSGKEPDYSTDFQRVRGVDGKEDILFAPETENYLGLIMETVIEPAGVQLIGKTYFDGLAVAASRTGSHPVLHLSSGYLHFDGMEEDSAEAVDLNDYKSWVQERVKDMPMYWPVLSMETVTGTSLSKLAEPDQELEKKTAELLLLLQCMMRGTPYLLQQDTEDHKEFVQKLLKLRREYQTLETGSLKMHNERLYDLMTFTRSGEDDIQFYVECNLSANANVVPYGRPQNAKKICSNYEGDAELLRPYEASVYRI